MVFDIPDETKRTSFIDRNIIIHLPEGRRAEAKTSVARLVTNYEGRDVDVLSVLCYAAEGGKFDEYLDRLGVYFRDDMIFIHPDARRLAVIPGAVRAGSFFLACYRDLGVQPRVV